MNLVADESVLQFREAERARVLELHNRSRHTACAFCTKPIETSGQHRCGTCKRAAYCDRGCQTKDWRKCHKKLCPWLKEVATLPRPSTADESDWNVMQLKLLDKSRAEGDFEQEKELIEGTRGQAPLPGLPTQLMQQILHSLMPGDRCMLAMDALVHTPVAWSRQPARVMLTPLDVVIFTLSAICSPMPLSEEASGAGGAEGATPLDRRRPYYVWIPTSDPEGSEIIPEFNRMLECVGITASGAWFCKKPCLDAMKYNGDVQYATCLDTFDDRMYFQEEEEEDKDSGDDASLKMASDGHGSVWQPSQLLPRLKVLVVGGLHMFPFEDDPMANMVLRALRVSLLVDAVGFQSKGDNRALADKLSSGEYCACVVLSLGSDGYKERNPTAPFKDGPWRDALTAYVRGGGALFVNGERTAAAVLQKWFQKTWRMEGDFYRRTTHELNDSSPEVQQCRKAFKVQALHDSYNVKACMLAGAPLRERVYSTEAGAQTYSLVPCMSGVPVDEGMCAMALGRFGEGTVAYFGDVNNDDVTLNALLQLIWGLSKARGLC